MPSEKLQLVLEGMRGWAVGLNGARIPVKELLSKAVVGVNQVSDRVLELQLAVVGRFIIFLVVYAPKVELTRLKRIRFS